MLQSDQKISKRAELAGGMVEGREGELATVQRHDARAALAMIDAFASVGARIFDLTITDQGGHEVPGLQRPGRSLDEMRRRIARDLHDAERNRHNVIIRPRSATALLIQLDDFSAEKAAEMEPYAFMTYQTSPLKWQAWLAVSDGPKESEKEAAKLFRTRVRRATKADHNATGATRIVGSLNFKPDYAPDFPVVRLGHVRTGGTVTVAALDNAGHVGPAETPQPPASSAPQKFSTRPALNRSWPDYQDVLAKGQRKADGQPDRSKADYWWCKYAVERGWSVDEIAAKLLEVSERAKERVKKRDFGYCRIVAENAEKSEQERRSRRQFLKSTAYPR
jgi:hypothetical protein